MLYEVCYIGFLAGNCYIGFLAGNCYIARFVIRGLLYSQICYMRVHRFGVPFYVRGPIRVRGRGSIMADPLPAW